MLQWSGYTCARVHARAHVRACARMCMYVHACIHVCRMLQQVEERGTEGDDVDLASALAAAGTTMHVRECVSARVSAWRTCTGWHSGDSLDEAIEHFRCDFE